MAVGMAYAGQEVAMVPVGAYDAALNAILTEQGFIR
jgi:5-formyltetrahydrofolate cyclo-ligase